VFPPFAGQGISAGFLDVMGLARCLVLALQNPSKDPTRMFDAWESERRTQIMQALKISMDRGSTFDEKNPLKVFCRDWTLWIMQCLPVLRTKLLESTKVTPVHQYAQGMSFLPELRGGVSFGQVYLRGADSAVHFLDDLIF
jgi:2-polyprenyl-6-methoxyphenol hydroxylase-like FAD-dependent oxidoreductase